MEIAMQATAAVTVKARVRRRFAIRSLSDVLAYRIESRARSAIAFWQVTLSGTSSQAYSSPLEAASSEIIRAVRVPLAP